MGHQGLRPGWEQRVGRWLRGGQLKTTMVSRRIICLESAAYALLLGSQFNLAAAQWFKLSSIGSARLHDTLC
jgi:hypothetical protein